MTAATVINQIKHLPHAEQSRVIEFALELAGKRQLPGEKLAELVQRMVDTDDETEAQKLRDEIHRGFYGK